MEIKTVLLLSGERLFSDAIINFLTSDRFPAFNILYIYAPSQITERLVFEDIDLIINDLTDECREFVELTMKIRRIHQGVKQIDILPYERGKTKENAVGRGDSLSRLESVIKSCIGADLEKADSDDDFKSIRRADKKTLMTVQNLFRLNDLYELYESGEKKRFMFLVESVLNISRNHNRLTRTAGELLAVNMTAFVNNFVSLYSLENEFEEAQFPELNYSDQVNNRMILAFWQRFCDLIFDLPHKEKNLAVVDRAKEFVEKNLRSELTVTMIADAVGVTSGYLSRAFSAGEGITLIQYVSGKKIEKSKIMLEDEKNSIKMIASEIGFSSPSYFIRFFKKFTGITPKQYRDKLRSKREETFSDRV